MGTMIENGYLALPESGSGPAVIVIQEWWGLVGHITDVVDRFAAAGFVAFYPGASWERHAPQWANFAGKAALIHCAQADGTSAAPGIQEALHEITAAGGSAKAYDYEGTQHAFFNNDRPEVYSELAAALAWERTLEFFLQALS